MDNNLPTILIYFSAGKNTLIHFFLFFFFPGISIFWHRLGVSRVLEKSFPTGFSGPRIASSCNARVFLWKRRIALVFNPKIHHRLFLLGEPLNFLIRDEKRRRPSKSLELLRSLLEEVYSLGEVYLKGKKGNIFA